MAKRLLTEKELGSIPKNLLDKYERMGFTPYINDEDPENEIVWGTDTQIIYDQVDNNTNSVDVPRFQFWAGVHTIYANFLWIVLFVALVIFTFLLMRYDFDIHKLYRAIKSLFYDYI